MQSYSTFLPLRATDLHILLSLADGDGYGYAIIKEVEERTEGAVRLKPGAFYRILSEMLRQGLVEERQGSDETGVATDKRRRYYGITVLGRNVARAELARMEAMTELGRARGLL